MRTSEKPSGHAPAFGVHACEATFAAATRHVGKDNKQSQVAALSAKILSIAFDQERTTTKGKSRWLAGWYSMSST